MRCICCVVDRFVKIKCFLLDVLNGVLHVRLPVKCVVHRNNIILLLVGMIPRSQFIEVSHFVVVSVF